MDLGNPHPLIKGTFQISSDLPMHAAARMKHLFCQGDACRCNALACWTCGEASASNVLPRPFLTGKQAKRSCKKTSFALAELFYMHACQQGLQCARRFQPAWWLCPLNIDVQMFG